ncbi:hypothetical protein ACS0TY_018209 [Phlomoides rotata]
MLTYLELRENNFAGALPSEIGQLYQLDFLGLTLNTFTGSIPPELSNISTLRSLGLAGNDLSGSLPTNLCSASPLLETLYLADNNFIGEIPTSLELSYNRFTGVAPHFLHNLSLLEHLHLSSNHLRIEPSSSCSTLSYCSQSQIKEEEGALPSEIGQLYQLDFLGLTLNTFTGPILECFGNVTSLRELHLDSNKLTSSIPSSLWSLMDLIKLELSQNSLSGTLPPEIGDLVATVHINISMNQLSGSIPRAIGNLQNLVNLSLAHNRLEGSIPVSVGGMINLVTLDLSYNNLSGPIPKSFETLKHLDYFNVSFNALSGEIPTGGPFGNFTKGSFKENKALCGIPRFHVPLCRIVPNHRSRRKKVEFALFSLAGVVVVVSLAFIYKRFRRKGKKDGKIDEQVHSAVPERISYYEFLQSTEQFNESNLLGIGSFGSIYRGVLRDGRVIVVKVFNTQTEAAAFRSFEVECEVFVTEI